MAKIILNVELNTKGAQSGLDLLKKSLSKVTATLNQMKPDKDLTAQIKALSEYYNSLAAAAKSAAEADSKAAVEAAKVAKAEQDVAKATAQRQKAETDAAAAVARKEAAEARALDTIDRTRAAMEKRAKATEDDEKALWNLEKAYAALSKRQEDVAAKTNVMDEALRDVADETEDTWKEIRAFNENGEALSSTVDELRERYERLAAQTASYEKELNAQAKAEIEATKASEQLVNSFQKSEENLDSLRIKLNNMLTAISNVENRYPAGTFDQLKNDIKAQISAIDELKESVSSSGGNMQEFIDKEQAADQSTKELSGRFSELKANTEHVAPAVATLGDKFENLVTRYAKFYASSLLVRKPLQLIQNALEDVGETLVKTEDAVIELNRVLDDPQPTMEAANRLYDIAYAYGSTFESASQIAANFARAGKSWNESLQATEAALLAMNVAELNATQASDGLLSIIAQFDMETSDLIDVVDKLNKTADKNPVSTQKLLQAIQRAGSAAKNANVSFDQTLGLITAISEATNRSGQNIGTAINSLIQYSTKNVDVFATLSKESEELVDRFKSGLASIVDVWNQVAIDIHNDKEARDNIISALGTDGLEELSSTLHDELGDLVSEINGVYDVANTYRKNYFIALLDNMDRFATVQEQLTDFQGYSQSENEKYMETYTAKVNQLQDAWQKLANDEQGILALKKSIVEMGIGVVDFIEKSGGIVNTIGTIAGIVLPLIAAIKSADIVNGVVKLYEGIQKLRQNLPEILSHLGDIGIRLDEWRAATEAVRVATLAEADATEIAALKEYAAAKGAAAWQAAMGWISAAITLISLAVGAINAYNAAQERARQEAISLGKETAEHAKQIGELRDKMTKLNPESEEYRKTEEQIVELLGDKQILLEGLIKGTEEYTKKVKELTDEELREAQYRSIRAKEAATTEANKDFNWSATMQGLSFEDKDLSILASSAKSIEEKYQAYLKISERLKELEREYVIAVASGDTAQQNSLDNRIKALDKFVNNTKDSMEEYRTAVENESALARLALDQSIEGVSASMYKIPASARKSQEELQAIAEENGMTLEEVQAAFEQVGQGAAEALEEIPEKVKDVTDMTEDELGEFAEKVTGTVGAYSAAADAIELVKEAQKEYAEQGQLSLDTVEKLAKLGADWVAVLFDESGAVDVNSEAVGSLVDKYQEWLDASGYLIDTTSEIAEKAKDLSSEIDDVQTSLSFLNSVQEEYNETGSLSIDTLQQLLSLDSEYLDLIIDEEGQIHLNKDAVDELLKSKNDLLDELMAEQVQQYAVDRANYYMSKSTEVVTEKTAAAAKGVSVLAATMRMLKGDSVESADALVSAVDEQVEALHRMALSSGFYNEDWEELWVADVQDYTDKLVAARQSLSEELSKSWESSSKSSGSSSSSSKSEKDEVLEGHKDLVSLLESELTLMEHQGKSEEEQIAKIREIQDALSAQADYMRSIGASQEDINKLSSEWWKWEEKINKFAEDRQKAAEKAAQEQKKAAEDAEKAAKKAAEEAKKAEEEAKKARIAALNEETNRHKQILSDLKAELNLWQKQGKGVSDQVDEMKKIQSALHDQAEWLRYLKATQDEIEVNQADIDALSAEWWDWQEKILKLYKETLDTQRDIELDEQKKVIDALLKGFDDMEASRKEELEINERILAVEKAREDVAEAIRNAQLDYIKSTLSGYIKALSDAKTLEEKQNAVIEARKKLVQAEQDARAKAIIDTFKAEKDVKSDALSLEEKRLAVEKARQALIDAQNERTTRVYNESSGQWEYQANAKNVQTAQETLKSAVDALNAYVEEQAWNEVSAAVEKGSVSEAEVLEILTKWARESYGEGSPEFITKIQAAFRKAMGTPASPESLSGQISAVDTAVQNLNEYLKQEAVKELEQYIAAGNTDSAGMRSILNKWLSMGEGGELYEWRDGLLDNLESAIHSGWYDDTKVTSYIEKVDASVESLHEYLRSRFIAEMKDLVQNGTADQMREAMNKWDERFSSVGAQIGESGFILSDEDKAWGSNLTNAKAQYDDIESFWQITGKPKYTEEEKQRVIAKMQENSRQWWMTTDKAEQQRLADLNYVLGTSMGWHRKQDGAWYDENDVRMYDKGGVVWNPGKRKSTGKQASSGVLRGVGGIKATDRPEIILDPELTEKILAPTSEKQFRAFAETMHLMFEKGGRTRAEMPVIRNPSVTDSHNTSYTVNGIPIPAASAERYTIAELFRMLPAARS